MQLVSSDVTILHWGMFLPVAHWQWRGVNWYSKTKEVVIIRTQVFQKHVTLLCFISINSSTGPHMIYLQKSGKFDTANKSETVSFVWFLCVCVYFAAFCLTAGIIKLQNRNRSTVFYQLLHWCSIIRDPFSICLASITASHIQTDELILNSAACCEPPPPLPSSPPRPPCCLSWTWGAATGKLSSQLTA